MIPSGTMVNGVDIELEGRRITMPVRFVMISLSVLKQDVHYHMTMR